MARPELTQEELARYVEAGKTMIWQYRTLYEIYYRKAQDSYSMKQVLRLPKDKLNVTKAGRFKAMTPEDAEKFLERAQGITSDDVRPVSEQDNKGGEPAMTTKFQGLRLQVVKEEQFPYSCKVNIDRPEDVRDLLTKSMEMHLEAEEVFIMITVDTKHRVTGIFEVARGHLNACLMHPREVFKRALLMNASGIFVAHNHPSGDVTPSRDDTMTTERLKEAGEVLGVPLLDHLIIGDSPEEYYSFAEAGIL